MKHTLPGIDYAYDALEPYIDARTMEIHHTKHHQTYIDKLNAALDNHPALQEASVQELVSALDTVPETIRTAVRNHGGGHANHSFFWPLLKKDVAPGGEVVNAINNKWGGLDQFRSEFASTATLLFGSGWTWLVWNGNDLEITTTPNQDSPLSRGHQPVLGLDVWEHAYYLKYQNRRPDYIEAFFNVINWAQVDANFKAVR
ncbi:MAG: superoxide dismutase [Desulfobacterales bacterium]|nr:superoxide dismutase [Desulfobacterales bacterium]MDJ0855326.1 superoxide dismutase [Desulfobacterales bacterium]MDJ0886505.1 superoxide dismutase [Desulfobacterales bacterium]MDJ0991884.1 superoxide dismutase [Desulfobacterales bacterium]